MLNKSCLRLEKSGLRSRSLSAKRGFFALLAGSCLVLLVLGSRTGARLEAAAGTPEIPAAKFTDVTRQAGVTFTQGIDVEVAHVRATTLGLLIAMEEAALPPSLMCQDTLVVDGGWTAV